MTGGAGSGTKVGHNVLEPAVTNSAKRNYRPPPGFMNKTLIGVDRMETAADRAKQTEPKEELIDALRLGGAQWYVLAEKLLVLRGAHAMDSNDVAMVCDIAPLTQDKWMTAANVRASLVADAEANEDDAETMTKLETTLEDEEAVEKLHAMRFMTLLERRDAIRLVIERELNVHDTLDLVRAYKQYVDLEGETLGFSGTARDRLAFFFYRRAQEQTRDARARHEFTERALSLAETEDARELCERLAFADGAADAGANATAAAKRVGVPSVEVVRLERNETSFMPVPFLGDVGSLTPTLVDALPSGTRKVGRFGVFSPGDGQWIALPMWQALMASTGAKLFAVICSSWRRFPGLKIKQLDDEQLLVICDVMTQPAAAEGAGANGASDSRVAENKYYLAWNSHATSSVSGTVSDSTRPQPNILTGEEILSAASSSEGDGTASAADAPLVFARVLLACLPPSSGSAGKIL